MKIDDMKAMWNKRFSEEGFAYGIEPNDFLKLSLAKYKIKGSILFPGEGEGRNAVYAAQQGLDVSAFDLSEVAKRKALELAKQKEVSIRYEVGSFDQVSMLKQQYDAIVMVFMHMPSQLMNECFRKCQNALTPDGLLIIEGFSVENLELREANPDVGGPGDPDFLYTKEKIMDVFTELDKVYLEEELIELKEGMFHNGQAKVIRYVGKKINYACG